MASTKIGRQLSQTRALAKKFRGNGDRALHAIGVGLACRCMLRVLRAHRG
jgi:hypothetical protein